MSNWANAIHASDLPGAIDPPPEATCPDCGEDIPAYLTRCDQCARVDRHHVEFEAEQQSHDDSRR